ncbi:MAG TPA: gephyrin-like molybdotransferase Glp [Bacteroidales bacterium]|nr:gephyrin-like molybdotransferase Glp [Bacteroidales bacterium]
MLKFEEAYKIVMEASFPTGTESIPFTESPGRVLASAVKSDMNIPPWNRSSVDGFACRHEDLGTALKVLETIAAGRMPSEVVTPGTCSRIMTGAAVPDGADYIFMLEDSETVEDGTVRFTGKEGKQNIAKTAEDVRKGETILTAGRFIRPQDVAVMAMAGATTVTVGCRVKVGVVCTGNELVEPDKVPAEAQIRNSNGWQLMAQVARAGAEARYYGIAADDVASTEQLLRKAVSENDMVLISGGVSAGDFDFVPQVITSMGLTIHFDQVAVQPGKPLTFCTGNRKIVFGLPGNPVSTFVQFEITVRPLIAKMMGVTAEVLPVMLLLGADWSRKRAGRMAWIPVTLNKEGEAVPIEYHGSTHITAMPQAWGIIAIPQGQSWIQKGEPVSVRQI